MHASGIALGAACVERSPRSVVFGSAISFVDGSRAARIDDHGLLEPCRIPTHYIDGDRELHNEVAELRSMLAAAVEQLNECTREIEAMRPLVGQLPPDVTERWAATRRPK